MKNLTLLVKPASSLCNMRCRYCFYADEAAHRNIPSHGIMDGDTVFQILTGAMEYIGEGGNLSIVFQGGEPTLAGAEYFASFAETGKRLLPAGAGIRYSIQTNGLALSQDMLSVFRKHRFLVGISLDGCRMLHDQNRLDPTGKGTWGKVLGNLRMLQSAGIETNALCVITGQAAQNPEKIYRTLKQLGLRYQQYIPCLDPLEGPRGSLPHSLTPQAYGQFLKDTFALWYADWKRGDYVSLRLFEDLVFNAMGQPCASCAVSGQCGQYLVVESNGDVYPCDFYCLDPWHLGNIRQNTVQQLLRCEKAIAFSTQRSQVSEACSRCPYSRLCKGGCFRDWERTDSGYHNYYCDAFREFFAYAMPYIQEIASAEQRSREK